MLQDKLQKFPKSLEEWRARKEELARKAKEARAAEERQRQQARKEAERKRAAEERAEAWNNCARDAFKFLFRAVPLCLLVGYFAAGIALWAGGAGSGAVEAGMWMVLAPIIAVGGIIFFVILNPITGGAALFWARR